MMILWFFNEYLLISIFDLFIFPAYANVIEINIAYTAWPKYFIVITDRKWTNNA